jgi:predicted  nucleic acid-binding Zn-ribbon protein
MYGETSKYYDFNKYYENKETIKQLRREIQDPDIKFDPKRHNNVNALNNKLNSIEKQLKQLRKKLREAKDIDNYVDRTVRVQELQDKQRKLVMQFNEMYDKLRK